MSAEKAPQPRVGIPYRTRKEELNNKREAYDKYIAAVRAAGGEPVEISLALSKPQLLELAEDLDAIVLPGSPADVEPSRFHAARHPNTAEADTHREETDFALLDHAIADHKPVLAICYGVQSLNVHQGGSLVQDIPSELHSKIQHSWPGHEGPEPYHEVTIDAGSRLAHLADGLQTQVNSSHHQSVLEPGESLKIVSLAPDGVVEAVEWTGDANWIVGVQWHPERMIAGDELARTLFRELVKAARKTPVHS
ncbi:MAG: gamma-glutamyl-gamma-aminobutyrate hydrolase family protein [Candidatus Acidiferrales bacterium]